MAEKALEKWEMRTKEDNIKLDHRETCCEDGRWME
jgi:hypothetical protein